MFLWRKTFIGLRWLYSCFFFLLLFIFFHYVLSLSPCFITEAGQTGSFFSEMTGWARDRRRNLRWQVVFSSLLNLASDVHLVMYRQLFPVHFELKSPWWIHILANIWSCFLFWPCRSCSMNVSVVFWLRNSTSYSDYAGMLLRSYDNPDVVLQWPTWNTWLFGPSRTPR